MPGYMYMDGLEEDESYIEVTDVHVQMKSLGSEKQISVDPVSIRDSISSSSSSSSSGNKAKELDIFHIKPPSKPKFLSYSLPNSTTSSPRFGSTTMSKKKAKNLNQDPILTVNPFFRQNSVALTNLERLREIHLRRSKSCGDGRASIPPEEFDLWPMKKSNTHHFLEGEGKVKETKQNDAESYDEKFKCGALCLFLPGLLGKAKPIKPRKEEPAEPVMEAENGGELQLVVSKRVSLEKFECGSWRSSAILDDTEADNKDSLSSNLFYELPLEMIRCNGNTDDTHSPVTSAFVFDKDRKGVLKKNSSRTTTTPKKSPDSSRHVRFSTTSSPKSHPTSPTSSCVTPRLLKAREDFNAFLEAQAA